MTTTFNRISKREAQQLFASNKPFYLCPCKLKPCTPWNVACLILNHNQWLAWAKCFATKDIEKQAWELMYESWKYYNASHEAGYYAHYYVEVERC
jgi:hypothetical protein